jgi:hypothetical protein
MNFIRPAGFGKVFWRNAITAPFGPGVELLDMRAAAKHLDVDKLQQAFHGGWQRPEPVDHFRAEPIDLIDIFQRRQSAVKLQA